MAADLTTIVQEQVMMTKHHKCELFGGKAVSKSGELTVSIVLI